MKRKAKKEIKRMGPNPNKITKKQLATIDFFFVELRNNRATSLSEEDCFFKAYQRAGYRSNRMQANKLFKEKKIQKEIKRLRPKKSRGAPRTEFNEETINNLYDLIEKSMEYSPACRAIGLDISTFGRWLKKGRDERKEGKTELESDHVKFINGLEAANEIGTRKLLDIVWKEVEGGHKSEEKTISYNSAGEEVFRSEKVKVKEPSFPAAKYMLAVKNPEKYGVNNNSGFGGKTKNEGVNQQVGERMLHITSLMFSDDLDMFKT